ncbi:MAG: histidine phosphatase family protein [Hyphomicrobium aestuarii]|nr:histidine phosphatase family protein [Hyphomicrobium aestuarii]
MLTLLLLLRHAKSSWDLAVASDHERPLAKRGMIAAPLIADHMAQHGWNPDHVLCSTAVRTRATLSLVLPRLQATPDISFDNDLYLADADQLLDRIKRLPRASTCAMLIGHNPGFEELARMLAGGGNAVALAALDKKFPTAGLAVITFDCDAWADVGPGKGLLCAFVTPRSLATAGGLSEDAGSSEDSGSSED